MIKAYHLGVIYMNNVKNKGQAVSRVDVRGSSCYDYVEIIHLFIWLCQTWTYFAIIFLLSALMIRIFMK